MWRVNLIVLHTFSRQDTCTTDIVAPILEWVAAHGSHGLMWQINDVCGEERVTCRIDNVFLRNEEISGELVAVAGHIAFLYGERFFLGPDEVSAPPPTLRELVQKALEVLPDEERTKAMTLSLREILGDTHQGGFNLPKATVLSECRRLMCPMCGVAGKLHLLDGHLICGGCRYDWGDVDELPEQM